MLYESFHGRLRLKVFHWGRLQRYSQTLGKAGKACHGLAYWVYSQVMKRIKVLLTNPLLYRPNVSFGMSGKNVWCLFLFLSRASLFFFFRQTPLFVGQKSNNFYFLHSLWRTITEKRFICEELPSSVEKLRLFIKKLFIVVNFKQKDNNFRKRFKICLMLLTVRQWCQSAEGA